MADETDRGALMRAEIAEQPQTLQRLLDSPGELTTMAARLREAAPRFVLLVARGTSDHAALYAKYLIETQLGIPAGLVSTSTFTAYDSALQMQDVAWIAVSQSGGSPDLVESTQAARESGALTVAVTNSPGSPLAAASEMHAGILAGDERSVAATKSYTSSLLALFILVEAWRGADLSAAQVVPGLAAQALESEGVDEVAARYRFVERLVTTSRGYAYPTARESALKLMETCYLSAHAFSGADLLHGPLAMVDEDRPVIAIVPEGRGGEALAPVLDRLGERRADLCVVGPRDALGGAPQASIRIDLPSGMDERVAPIAQIIPLQRVALQLATSRGYDPDHPRGLRKVTETL